MARGLDGVKVKMVLVTSWVMGPLTPGLRVKVVVLVVAVFIGFLKVAVRTAREHTPVAPVRGVAEITTGGGSHALAAVLKLHTKLRARPIPKTFLARVVMVAVRWCSRPAGSRG